MTTEKAESNAVGRWRAAVRLTAVFVTLMPLVVELSRDRRRWLVFGGPREVDGAVRRRRAVRLRRAFEELGPVFVKLGQALSTRSDALPVEYTEELAKLQDEVSPAPWTEVERTLKEDVGDPEAVFDGFERSPVNSASIGQVYRARVDGRRVAVKVRRPRVEKAVELDMAALNLAEGVLGWFLDDADGYTLSRVLDQFDELVHEELDYRREREAMKEVGNAFRGDSRVRVPEVYEDFSGRRVTTMEWVDGVGVDEVAGLDGVDASSVVEKLQGVYAEMVLEHGVFHADPHPGNVAVADDGAVVLYDFGAVGRLSPETRDSLFEFYDALRDEDYDRMVAAFVELDMLPVDVDRVEVDEMFREMRAELKEEGLSGDAGNMVTSVQDCLRGNRVTASKELVMLFRTVSTLEAVCSELDESFEFTREAYVYVLGTRSTAVASAFDSLPDAVADVFDPETVAMLKRRADSVAGYFEDVASMSPRADG